MNRVKSEPVDRNVYPCPGDAHAPELLVRNIDHCDTCMSYSWGKVPARVVISLEARWLLLAVLGATGGWIRASGAPHDAVVELEGYGLVTRVEGVVSRRDRAKIYLPMIRLTDEGYEQATALRAEEGVVKKAVAR
jgi:hypothetical protein